MFKTDSTDGKPVQRSRHWWVTREVIPGHVAAEQEAEHEDEEADAQDDDVDVEVQVEELL